MVLLGISFMNIAFICLKAAVFNVHNNTVLDFLRSKRGRGMIMEVLSEDEVDAAEAMRIMEEKKKERELVYEQKICTEYLEKIPKISPAKLKQLVEELGKISILKPRYIALITTMLPDTEQEVETLFSKERTNLKKEEVKQIAEIVNKYK